MISRTVPSSCRDRSTVGCTFRGHGASPYLNPTPLLGICQGCACRILGCAGNCFDSDASNINFGMRFACAKKVDRTA